MRGKIAILRQAAAALLDDGPEGQVDAEMADA